MVKENRETQYHNSIRTYFSMRKIILILSILVLSITLCSCGTKVKYTDKKDGQVVKDNNTSIKTNLDDKGSTEGIEGEDVIVNDPLEVPIDSSKIIKIKAQLDDGRYWAELAVTDDGKILGFTQTGDNMASEMFFYDIDSDTIEFFHTLEVGWLPCEAQVNDKYVIWNEYIQIDYTKKSTKIMMLNKDTNEILKIDEKLNVSVDLPFEKIAIGNDKVLWSTGYLKDNSIIHCIMEFDIHNGETVKLKEMATYPVVGEDFWVWIGPEDDKLVRNAVYIEDEAGNVEKISKDISPNYIATNGDILVYSGPIESNDEKNMTSNILIYDNGSTKKINFTTGYDYFEFPAVNRKFIGWRGTEKLRLYSIEENKIYILTDKYARYTDIKMNDEYVMWHGPVIEDEEEARRDAINNGMYLSYIYLLKSN